MHLSTAQVAGAIITLISISIALVLGFMKPSKTVRTGTAVLIVVALTVAALLFTVWKEGTQAAPGAAPADRNLASQGTSTSQSAETAKSIETTIPPTTLEPRASSGAEGATPPASDMTELNMQYLSDLKPVSNHYGAKAGSAEIGQQVYPHSVWVAVGGCSESTHAVEYNIAATARTFTSSIGLNKRSYTGFKVHFQVYLDGSPYGSGYMKETFQPAESITLPVAGRSRIMLTAVWISGGDCNDTTTIGYATWGDALLS